MTNKRLSAILISTAVMLTGCVTPTARIAFPVAEYESLPKTGTGIVKGQAFLKTRGGDVKTAAGNEIALNPVTSYSNQWYEQGYLLNKPMQPVDSRLEKYRITKIGNAQGEFIFKNVPPGEYYLVTQIAWEVPYGSMMTTTGATIAKKISVQNGEEVEVILTR